MIISYAITVSIEVQELETLLDLLDRTIDKNDEVVVLIDSSNTKPEIYELLIKYKTNIPTLTWHERPFLRQFAEHKNYLNSKCTGDYIFAIDADEIPPIDLVENIHMILESNKECDLFWVPRINKVNGLTEEHITKWGWNVNEKGYINFPDYQARLYRNTSDIKWDGVVHERIVGHKTQVLLPIDDRFSLYHEKEITKQEQQNNLYSTLS